MQRQQIICPNCMHCFTINDKPKINRKRRMDEDICNLVQKTMMLYINHTPDRRIGPEYNDGFEHFTNLPLEMKIHIFSFVDEEEYNIVKKVCNEWRNLFNYLECNTFDPIPFPDRKWIQLQEWEQKKILDNELDEYMYVNSLAKYIENIKF